MPTLGTLEVLTGQQRGQQFPLTQAVIVIGRDRRAAQIPLSDRSVSRQHARITFDATGATIENLSQKNPARVNGQPISGRTRLGDSAVITLGAAQVRFQAAAHAPAAPQSHPHGSSSGSISRVVVRLPSGQRIEARLSKAVVTLGRASDNDIVIDSPTISRHHARLERQGDTYRIVDLDSTNGLICDKQRIRERALRPHDVIHIRDGQSGKYVSLELLADESRSAASPATKVLPLAQHITIGRDRQNSVPLDHPQVSRFHARIDAATKGYVLSDLSSSNGTFVNGQRVARDLLRRGEVVQIGIFRFAFDFEHGQLTQQSQRAGIRLDALNVTQLAPGNPKPILRDVTLVVEPNDFVALVGSSGAGKTTLMKALNGFQPAAHGDVLINGDDLYAHFDAYRSIIGYVPQDDIVHGDLTVRRTLEYAALLRLPPDTGPGERARRIDH
ncbi:MAG: FHA domain-containing protein, partial [Chloroflexota bacterium]